MSDRRHGHAPQRGRRVVFTSDRLPLAGTLLAPSGDGPHPAVLLVPGSGPVDRNSDHRRLRLGITRLLAEALAQVGVATLRYDKRGVGDSGGNFMVTGLSDNITDARAALRALRAFPDIDEDRVVVIGHSEGAFIAGAVAAGDQKLAGVALLSGAARSGADVLRWQVRALLPTLPRALRTLMGALRIDVVARHERNLQRLRVTTGDVERIGGRQHNARWFREFLDYDPRHDLRRIEVPVLALTGDKDLQAPPEDVNCMRGVVSGSFAGGVLTDVNHILRHEPGDPTLRRYRAQVRAGLHSSVVEALRSFAADALHTGRG